MTRRRTGRSLGCLSLAVVVVAGGAVGAGLHASRQGWIEPLPIEDRCVVTGSTGTVVLTHEQARLTTIIVGRSVAKRLSPRAATIAMATAYQESGIRNLHHGDRDSLGLFQQRPSKGWGTPEQIRDPWYAADRFYDALVKVPGWDTADVNDTAQAVQRSGHPDAYRKHEARARVLAEVFTGHRAAGVTCALRAKEKPLCFDCHLSVEVSAFFADARRTFTGLGGDEGEDRIRFHPRDPVEAWRLGAYAVVNGPHHGLTLVDVGERTWRNRRLWPADWSPGGDHGSVTVRPF